MYRKYFQLQSLAHFSGGSRKLSMGRPTNIKFKNKVAEGSFLSWGEAGRRGVMVPTAGPILYLFHMIHIWHKMLKPPIQLPPLPYMSMDPVILQETYGI